MTADVARAVCATLDRAIAPSRPNDDLEARDAIEKVALRSMSRDAADRLEYALTVTHAYQAHQTRVGILPGS